MCVPLVWTLIDSDGGLFSSLGLPLASHSAWRLLDDHQASGKPLGQLLMSQLRPCMVRHSDYLLIKVDIYCRYIYIRIAPPPTISLLNLSLLGKDWGQRMAPRKRCRLLDAHGVVR